MLKKIGTQVVFVVFLLGQAIAQPVPDPSLWNVVLNPSGDQAVPLIIYDQVTGVVSIDTLGLNRIDDTPDYTMGGPIIADDVRLISLRIRTFAAGFVLPPFDGSLFQGRAWNTSVSPSSYFLLSVSAGNAFLSPGQYDWLQLPTELDSSDFFDEVEVVVNFDANSSGTRIVAPENGVTIVPEPAECTNPCWMVILMLLLRGKATSQKEQTSRRLVDCYE